MIAESPKIRMKKNELKSKDKEKRSDKRREKKDIKQKQKEKGIIKRLRRMS